MGTTLCVANPKGGVGKTTTSVNLADGLAKSGKRTLLVDLDPHCSATQALGLVPPDRHPFMLLEAAGDFATPSKSDFFAFCPSSSSYREMDLLAQCSEDVLGVLSAQFESCAERFDYIVLDCPSSLGALQQAVLAHSREVLIPMECEYFAMEGLTEMIHLIRDVMNYKNRELDFGGILLTKYDESLESSGVVEAEIREFFGEVVFDTVIPKDAVTCEAFYSGNTILDYAPRSRIARAYVELSMEVIDREQ